MRSVQAAPTLVALCVVLVAVVFSRFSYVILSDISRIHKLFYVTFFPNSQPPFPKVGFAFIVYDELSHPKAWQAWAEEADRSFEGNPPVRYRYHASKAFINNQTDAEKLADIDSHLPPFLQGAAVRQHRPSGWGVTGEVLDQIMGELFEDPSVQWVALISGTHVPMRPFSVLYRQLTTAGTSASWVQSMAGFESLGGWIALDDGVPFPKLELWAVWSRHHASLFMTKLTPISKRWSSWVNGKGLGFAWDEVMPSYRVAQSLSRPEIESQFKFCYLLFVCWDHLKNLGHPGCAAFNNSGTGHRPYEFKEVSFERWKPLVDDYPETVLGRKFRKGCTLKDWSEGTTLDDYLSTEFTNMSRIVNTPSHNNKLRDMTTKQATLEKTVVASL